jgi:hypothetical protein
MVEMGNRQGLPEELRKILEKYVDDDNKVKQK